MDGKPSPFGAIAGVYRRRLVCLFAVVSLFTIHSPLATTLYAADPGVEFGAEDDLTVLGVQGSEADPDIELKGFTVFGATQAAYTGAVAGPGNVVVNGILSVSSGAYFAADSTFTAITVSSIKTSGAGVTFSTSAYFMNGSVGVGTTSPGAKLDVVGGNVRSGGSFKALGGVPFAGGANAGYSFSGGSGDTDGGMFSTADGIIDIYGNNQKLATFDGDGAQGIYFNFNVGISTGAPQARLDVLAAGSAAADMAQIWRNSGGTIISSMSATGVMMAAKFIGDGSGLSGLGGTLSGGQAPMLSYWTSANSLGNSNLSRDSDASLTAMASTFTVQGSAFSVGGSTFVVAGGNVGIGTTNPNERLEVDGNARITYPNSLQLLGPAETIRYDNAAISPAHGMLLTAHGTRNFIFGTYDGTTYSGTRMIIMPSGNVGIGTTGPGAKLEVAGNLLFSQGADRIISIANATGINGDALTIAAGAGTTATSGAITVRGGEGGTSTHGGAATFRGGDASGASLANGGVVTIRGGSGAGGGTIGGVILQPTAGNVGIGTTGPGAKLHVEGQMRLFGGEGLYIRDTSTWLWPRSTGDLAIGAGNNDRLYITSGGNVGIGTTNPDGNVVAEKNQNAPTTIKIKNANDAVNAQSTLALVGMTGKTVTLSYVPPSETVFGFNVPTYGMGVLNAHGGVLVRGYQTGNNIAFFDELNNRVGIGTTNPGYKLDVAGDARVTGNIYIATTTAFPTPTAYYLGNGAGMANPANATDSNLTTFSGEGSYTGNGGAGNEAGLLLDFGSVVLRRTNIKLGYRASGVNSGTWIIEQSDDNSTYYEINRGDVNPGAGEVIKYISAIFAGRYLRVKIGSSTTSGIVTYLKVYAID